MNNLYEALEGIVIAERYYNYVYTQLEELENKVRLAQKDLDLARTKFGMLVSKTKEEIANK